MEPMTLGSPGSPSANSAASNFLPAFLMGESAMPTAATTPARNNTLSPKGRTLAFAQSPRGGSAAAAAAASTSSGGDLHNRSILQQKTLFGFQQQHSSSPAAGHHHNYSASAQQQNVSLSGPPALGLFDDLKSQKNRLSDSPFSQRSSAAAAANQPNNTSMQFNQFQSYHNESGVVNDSYLLNQSGFNVSRLASPSATVDHQPGAFNDSLNNHLSFTSPRHHQQTSSAGHQHNHNWITVFGFAPADTNGILAHFSQCGTIVDKVFPQHGSGNWVHLRFASRLECDRALNYNERIIGNNLIIGVMHCKDSSVVVDKENASSLAADRSIPVNRVRPLAHAAYKSAHMSSDVVLSPDTPKRTTGIVNKAMDMIFGW